MSHPEEEVKEIFEAFSLTRLLTPSELSGHELNSLSKEFGENSEDVIAFYNNSFDEKADIGLLLTKKSLTQRQRDGENSNPEGVALERFPWKSLYFLLDASTLKKEQIKLANGKIIIAAEDSESFLNLLKKITPIMYLGFDPVKFKSLYSHSSQDVNVQKNKEPGEELKDNKEKSLHVNKINRSSDDYVDSEPDKIEEDSESNRIPYWIIGGVVAFTVAFYLISTAIIQTEKAYLGIDNQDLCYAGVATVMNQHQQNVNYSGSVDGVHFYHYRRADDGSLWNFKCKVSGRTIIWGTKNGPWRNRSSDPKVTWEKEGTSAFRITEEGVRSRVFRSR